MKLLSTDKGKMTVVMAKPFEPIQSCLAAAWFNLGGTCVMYMTPSEFFALKPEKLAQAA